MDASFAQLLSRVYELEGLLLLADKKGEATPGKVVDLIKEKARAIDTAAQQLMPGTAQAQPCAAPQAEGDNELFPPKEGNGLPSNDYDPDETWQHDNGEEPGEIFGSGIAYVEPQHVPDEPEAKQHPGQDTNSDDEPVPPAFIPGNIDMTPSNDDIDDAEESVRVDEQLQRNLSKNMRKALSLNDRYRFKRELFGNSELDLNDALDMVQSMKSYDEATDYFYGDLGWDKDNEEVQDFMNIVKKHFL